MSVTSDKALEAIDLGKEILKLIDELPEQATDFAASVEEKTNSICSWVHNNNHATDKQIAALEGMLGGCEKWVND